MPRGGPGNLVGLSRVKTLLDALEYRYCWMNSLTQRRRSGRGSKISTLRAGYNAAP